MSRFLLYLSIVLLLVLGVSCRDDSVTVYSTPPPSVGSTQVIGITSESVILKATITSKASSFTMHFDYGTTLPYSRSTPTRSLGDGTLPVAVAETVATLSPGTAYHYRVVATNDGGTVASADSLFTTWQFEMLTPMARTDTASGITQFGAQLFGTVNPRLIAATCYFEYSSANGGPSRTNDIVVGGGGVDIHVSDGIGALLPETTYKYRIVAKNSVGYAYGEYKSFTTLADPPDLMQGPAFILSNTKVEIEVFVLRPGSSTLCHVEYGTTGNYGHSTLPQPLGTESREFIAELENLTPGSMYHWRVVASYSGSTTYGPDSTFVLPVSVKPFTIPLKIGLRWKYLWYSTSIGHTGAHTWEITGNDGSSNWNVIDIRQDTVYSAGSWIPRTDTVSFILKDLPDYYQIDFPEWLGLFDQTKRMPKWIESSKDSIFYNRSLQIFAGQRENVGFANGVGLVSYGGGGPHMSSVHNELTLLEYSSQGVQKRR